MTPGASPGPRAPPTTSRVERALQAPTGMRCECCGNEYDKAFEVVSGGARHVFDCFECAIHVLAPRCAMCGVAVIGHGVEAGGTYYCCAHCARGAGAPGVKDRA